MSNESFDKKIRNKLDQFEPEFQDQDWNNFSPLLRTQKAWWTKYRKSMAYAAAAIALILLTFQNYNLSIENRQLHSNIQKIFQEKQVTSNLPVITRDTVYIIKEKYVFTENTNTAQSAGNAVRSGGKAKNEVKQVLAKTDIIVGDISKGPHKQNNSPISQDGALDSQKTDNTSANNRGKIDINSLLETNTLATIERLYPAPIQSTVMKLQIMKPARQEFLPQLTIKKTKQHAGHLAVGVGATVRDDYHSFGLSALYSIGKHFQLGAGLQYGLGRYETFRDNDDFKKHHKIDFRNKFDQPVPKDVSFTDIRSNMKEWAIPLSLQYKFPIYRWINGYAGAGTILELNSTDHFAYQYSENGNSPAAGTLPSRESVFNISQIVFGAGVQANIKSFAIRLEPFCLLDTKSRINDRAPHLDLGMKTQLLYRF